MKIGLLGGTFNPIHFGHLHLAVEVREKMNLDQVLFIPAGIPPHKKSEELASPSDRYEMIKLAISGRPALDVSRIETDRTESSFTVQTVRALLREPSGNHYSFIIGIDAFLEFETWREPRELLQLIPFIVVSRPGFKFSQLKALSFLSRLRDDQFEKIDRAIIPRLDLDIPPYQTLTLLNVSPSPISASEIRDRIKKGLEISNKVLPEPVKSFIINKKVFLN
jgi:nicotinate-nucleotide adenylyltransferase